MEESDFHFICSVILNSLLNVPIPHPLAKYTPEKAAFHALHMITWNHMDPRKLGSHFLNVQFYFLIEYHRNSLLGVGSLAISLLSGSIATKGREAGTSSSVYVWLKCFTNLCTVSVPPGNKWIKAGITNIFPHQPFCCVFIAGFISDDFENTFSPYKLS